MTSVFFVEINPPGRGIIRIRCYKAVDSFRSVEVPVATSVSAVKQ